ncbi:MAG: ABC transporter permease, partial [Steroidobacteraceae bacterium]
LAAYGLKLAAGRWFTASEVVELRYYDNRFPPIIVVTKTLAQVLFPGRSALGQVIYLPPHQACRIVGIIDDVQSPSAANGGIVDRSVFLPMLPMNTGATYVVRTRPGQLLGAMRVAPEVLYRLDPQRIIQGVRTFAEIRRQAYANDRAIGIVLGAVCAALLAVTAFGVVGLTTYWVTQRRQFIGMRRALGARRLDILRYFHTENLLISGAGAALGIALGLGANLLLAQNLELTRLGISYISVGALIVLGLCQVAVLWPALRAAAVAPAAAIRGL